MVSLTSGIYTVTSQTVRADRYHNSEHFTILLPLVPESQEHQKPPQNISRHRITMAAVIDMSESAAVCDHQRNSKQVATPTGNATTTRPLTFHTLQIDSWLTRTFSALVSAQSSGKGCLHG